MIPFLNQPFLHQDPMRRIHVYIYYIPLGVGYKHNKRRLWVPMVDSCWSWQSVVHDHRDITLRGEAMAPPMSRLAKFCHQSFSQKFAGPAIFCTKNQRTGKNTWNPQCPRNPCWFHVCLFFYLIHFTCVSLSWWLDFTERFPNHKLHFSIWILQSLSILVLPGRTQLPGEKETKRHVLLRAGIQRWKQSVPSSEKPVSNGTVGAMVLMKQPSWIRYIEL